MNTARDAYVKFALLPKEVKLPILKRLKEAAIVDTNRQIPFTSETPSLLEVKGFFSVTPEGIFDSIGVKVYPEL